MSLLDFLTAGAAAEGAAVAGAGAAAAGAAAGVAGLAGATAVCAKDMAEEATKTAAISVCLNMFSTFKGGKSATTLQRFMALVR